MSDIVAIRKRPGMYLGLAENRLDLHQLVSECVGSAIKDARRAATPQIDVVLHADGSCSVSDNGPGVWNRLSHTGNAAVGERILTELLAELSAGLDDEWEPFMLSASLPVVNGLSEHMTVRVRAQGTERLCTFRRGIPQGTSKSAPCAADKNGTTINFLPDKMLFGADAFDAAAIARRMLPLTFFLPAGSLTLTDARATDPCRTPIGL